MKSLMLPRFIRDARRITALTPPALRRRRHFVLGWQILNAGLESLTIIVISFFCLVLASPQAVRSHFIYAWLAERFPAFATDSHASDRQIVFFLCLAVAAFVLVKNVAAWLASGRATRYAELVGLSVGEDLLTRYFAHDYAWHLSGRGAALLNGFAHRHHLTLLLAATLQLYGYVVCACAMLAGLFVLEPKLTALVGAVFLCVGGTAYALLRRPMERHGAEAARLAAIEGSAVAFSASGMREIILYHRQDAFRAAIGTAMRDAIPAKAFLAHASLIPAWVLESAGFIAVFAAMSFMLWTGQPLPAIVASMSMLLLTAWRILPAVNRSWGLAVHIRGLRPFALICLEEAEKRQGQPLVWANPDPEFHFQTALRLEQATFTYPGAAAPALSDINMDVERGASLALIGRSGAGKTTLAMLLAGLLEPDGGSMAVDGVPLTAERREALRRRVGMVPQNPVWLPGSVADNVALADWGRSRDDQRVEEVCRLAGLDWLLNHPPGLGYPIGPHGEGLSGGQAQRLALARALYARPEILILDEATSSLDGAGESGIRDAMGRLSPGITTIVIAHRLGSVAGCGQAVWLEDGRIREQGRATELLPRYEEFLRVNSDCMAQDVSA